MRLTRLAQPIAAEAFPPDDLIFDEGIAVQSGRLFRGGNYLRIESGGRFKRFCAGRELVGVAEGSGFIKWARGETPFAAGDAFEADGEGEYELYGVGRYYIAKR